MSEIEYTIPAIHCAHCVHTIKLELSELEGVREVLVDENTKKATIRYEPPANEAGIVALLKEIQYPPEGADLLQVG
ncbi:MAG TPA: heavy metal-associated domain-containing protein [Anaerolineales bacterium]|nr:heavy metal-associated domain-containing protein [Anaerolineales bacterium]